MTNWGFSVYAVKDISASGMTVNDLLAALASGPAVLLHLCSGFPYGPQWASQTFTASDAHAVVLTGIDTDAGKATFNNPWGDKDQACDLSTLVQKITSDQMLGKTLAFWGS